LKEIFSHFWKYKSIIWAGAFLDSSLRLMHNDTAYQVYSEVLAKQRKSGKGLISAKSTFSDPKKMAQLGFEEGIGFVPFAGIGWKAIKEVRKDDSSPLRAAAAKVLADDPDPATTKVLEAAAGDNSWLVRAAALEALARRGDPAALDTASRFHPVCIKLVLAISIMSLTPILQQLRAAILLLVMQGENYRTGRLLQPI
jgi:HEAT repeat protein